MNPLNYASLEASKRLVEAGIVPLYVDKAWIHDKWKDTWELGAVTPTIEFHPERWEFYPAPSMAEVWRELPATIPDRGLYAPVKLRKAGDGKTWVSYFRVGSQIIDSIKADTNPTDALIDLLIWVRKEKK